MRDLDQWLVWRREKRRGEWTKVPYSPLTGVGASSTAPETWAGYQEAVKACKEHSYDGIGFVFTSEDDFCGVDLDKCLDPETGEIEPWAQQIVELLNSHTEISPSGTGVHVLVRAKLPEGRNRKGRFEAYDRGRYFTVTGKHLPGSPQSIEGRQEELENVVRRVFGSEIPESTNGHTRPVAAPRRVEAGLVVVDPLMAFLSGETGERGRGQWLWKLPVVDLVDDEIKDAKGCQNIDGGILNHTEGIEEPKPRIDKPDSLRMPTTGNEPIKDANLIKHARVPTIGDVGTLNYDETEMIKDAHSGILKECIHGLEPDSCNVCNGNVKRLVEEGAVCVFMNLKPIDKGREVLGEGDVPRAASRRHNGGCSRKVLPRPFPNRKDGQHDGPPRRARPRAEGEEEGQGGRRAPARRVEPTEETPL